MSDIIREVDEELRRERLLKLWQRHGHLIVGAAVVLVLAVAGWRAYEWYQAREAARIGARFEAALKLAAEAKPREAEESFAAIVSEAPAGYRVLARIAQAAEIARGDAKAGVAAFDAIAADRSVDPVMRELAQVRAAMLLVDSAPVAEIVTRLQPLAAAGSTFRHSARELLALARYKAGELEAARTLLFQVMTDPEVPPSMRNRVQLLFAMIAGGAPGQPGLAAPTQ